MKIAVIGTGYVGLVTGTCLAEVGHEVICVDIDETKIAKLKKGIVPIFEPGLSELVLKNHKAERLDFTTLLKDIGAPDAVFFALPTPPNGDGEADLSFVLKAAKDTARVIKGYTVFVNKSTVPVGTAQKVHDVIKAETKHGFDVVSNPEFLREGLAVDDFMQPDRIVVGTSSDKARKVMEQIYQPFVSTGAKLLCMDEASSEMTKYAANSFLALKISFINEVANMCELTGADIQQVSAAVGADTRIGHRFLNAGIGYGGSCFPKDVMALERSAHLHDYDFKLLKAVMDVNARQRQLFVQKVVTRYGENLAGKTFAILGLAFKPDTDDIREAPALDIIRELHGRGATINVFDPEAMDNVRRVFDDSINYAKDAQTAMKAADALMVLTDWKEFASVELGYMAKTLKDKTVFDGRNMFAAQDMDKAGLTYISVGRKAVRA